MLVLGLLSLCAVLSWTVVYATFNEISADIAKNEAEKLAWQLEIGGFVTPGWRKPATGGEQLQEVPFEPEPGIFPVHGEIGRDPWGQAFRYSLVRDSQGTPEYLLVWSAGPNQKYESVSSRISFSTQGTPKFQGDDLGIYRQMAK